MGLHLCYEITLPAECDEGFVAMRMEELRQHALRLPFAEVSELVRLDARAVAEQRPLRGLAWESLEHVVQYNASFMRDQLYRESLGICRDDESAIFGARAVNAPVDAPVSVIGFAIDPGERCEPAHFGLTRLAGPEITTRWWDHCCCKTQYASIVSDEHLMRCHGSLVSLLDFAVDLGFGVEVRDETGYWDSRDPQTLFAAAAEMNRIVARLGGVLNDAVRDAMGDSSVVGGAIFEHPEFERLEGDGSS